VAAHFGISRGLCCQIIKGEILRTTQGYLHPRLSRVLQAAVKLNRK
jgi:hypothetical protein